MTDTMTAPPATSAVPAHVPAERVFDFDVYGVTAVVGVDYATAYKDAQDSGPLPDLFWTTANGGHWVGTRADIIDRVFSDHDTFSARLTMVPAAINHDPPMLPVQADPPDWEKYRIFFNKALSQKQVHALTITAREIAIELIESFKDRGHCEFVDEFSYHLPVNIFMQISGLPSDDRGMLLDLVHAMMRARDDAERGRLYQVLGTYAMTKIRERRANPGPGAISDMANSLIDGELIPEHVLIGMTGLLFLAGLDTVAGMMGFFMWHLAKHPDQQRILREQPSKIPDAVEELLRRYPISANARVLVKDAEYDGVTMKAGDMIAIPTPLHNMDERRYPSPRDVDFDRKPRHVTFGGGVHRCAGANLARAELRILLEEWLPRIPDFEIDPQAHMAMSGTVVASLVALPLVWPVQP